MAGDSAPTPALSPVARERRKGLDIHCGLQAPVPMAQLQLVVSMVTWNATGSRKVGSSHGFSLPYLRVSTTAARRAIALLEFVVPLKQSEFVMRKQKASK